MYCQYCATELPNDSKFCPSCGKPVNGTTTCSEFPAVHIADQVAQERERRKQVFSKDEIHHFEEQNKIAARFLLVGKIIYFVFAFIPVLISFGAGGFLSGVIAIIIVWSIYRFIRYYFHRDDCPNCKSYASMQDTRSDHYGSLYSTKGKDHSYHYNMNRHYQVCYKCGYSRIDERIE